MSDSAITPEIDTTKIKALLKRHKAQMKMALRVCAHCTLCAESCFLYQARGKDPKYVPSHKFINSIGKLYKKRGKVDRSELQAIQEIVWERCVLCTRCYCPLGIDIPAMVSLARTICRSQNLAPDFAKLGFPEAYVAHQPATE